MLGSRMVQSCEIDFLPCFLQCLPDFLFLLKKDLHQKIYLYYLHHYFCTVKCYVKIYKNYHIYTYQCSWNWNIPWAWLDLACVRSCLVLRYLLCNVADLSHSVYLSCAIPLQLVQGYPLLLYSLSYHMYSSHRWDLPHGVSEILTCHLHCI